MIHYRVSYENPAHLLPANCSYAGRGRRCYRSAGAAATRVAARAATSCRTSRQKIQRVEVDDAATDQPLPYRKLTKDRWEVANAAGRTVRVRYNFYAHQMDAGGSWLDETQLYLNPVQALMYAEGRQQEACELTLAVPEGWQWPAGCLKPAPHVLAAAKFRPAGRFAAHCQPYAAAPAVRGGRAALPRVGAGRSGW